VHSRTILGTARLAKYQPDTYIQWFAVRLNQRQEHTSACAGSFLGEKHRSLESRWVNNNANRYRRKVSTTRVCLGEGKTRD
jgi:hypothetical protein